MVNSLNSCEKVLVSITDVNLRFPGGLGVDMWLACTIRSTARCIQLTGCFGSTTCGKPRSQTEQYADRRNPNSSHRQQL